MMHMSTGFHYNFTINSLSPSHQTFSTQLAVLLTHNTAIFRWLSSPPELIILKMSLLQSSSPGHLVPLIRRIFIPNRAISCFMFSNFPFCSKVLTFQHALVRILLEDDWECLTSFHAEWYSARPWLTASFTPLTFDTIAQSMSSPEENKARWFPIAFLVVFDTGFSFTSWWAALIPHRTVCYIQLRWRECTSCLL